MKNEVRLFALLFALIMTFSLAAGPAMAETKESPFKSMVTKIFPFLGKTTEKSVNAVGTGIKKSADIVVNEVKDAGELSKGKGEKVKDVIVKPIADTAQMVGETVHGVVTAPIEAGKEVSGTK